MHNRYAPSGFRTHDLSTCPGHGLHHTVGNLTHTFWRNMSHSTYVCPAWMFDQYIYSLYVKSAAVICHTASSSSITHLTMPFFASWDLDFQYL